REILDPNELHIEIDGHRLADQEPTGLEGGVPTEAEVLAVDLGGSGEAGSGAAPRIAGHAFVGDVEDDRAGDAGDGELALELPLVVVPVHLRRAEAEVRVGRHVEEVAATKVVIALGVVGVDRGGGDGDRDGGVPRVLADLDRALELGEPASRLRQAEVLDLEVHAGVADVDGPRAGRRQFDAVDGPDGGGGGRGL